MKGYWWLAFWVGALSPLSYILVLSAIEMGAPLSLVAPAREMSMMVGAMFGMLILGERVTAWRVVGCAILIGGVVLLGSARRRARSPCPDAVQRPCAAPQSRDPSPQRMDPGSHR